MSGRTSGSATIDVAIVTYQSAEQISACLESLKNSTGVAIEMIAVVDNASTDKTAGLIAEDFPAVDLIRSEENLGFGAATNLGSGKGKSEYLLVLNPDVSLAPDALAALVETMRSNPRIGIAGCRLLLPDGSEDHAARRSFPTPLSALSHFAGLSKRVRSPKAMQAYLAPDSAAGGEVDAVNGALMLIRREWFEQLGGFDESYWMYMEDLDLCWRFRERGWLTWYQPSVQAVHVKGASSGRFRSWRLNWAFHRGMIRFYHDHLAVDHNPLYNLFIYFGVLVKFSVSALKSGIGRALRLDGSQTR